MRCVLRHVATMILLLAACTMLKAQEERVEQLQTAATLIQQNRLDNAQLVLEALLAKSPEDAVALNLLGLLRLRQKRASEAEQLFQRAIDTGHAIPGPHINLAIVYAVDQPLKALDELNEALKISPGNQQAEEMVRSVTKRASLTAADSGQKDQAVAISVKARSIAPKDPEVLYDFGMVCLQAALYSDAQNALEQALRIRPSYGDAQYALARAYLNENLAAQAEEEMRRYLKGNSGDASAYYGLGYILVAEQKLDAAKAAFNKSLELEPQQTESIYQLGDIALEQEQTDDARSKFSEVLARNAHHAGALTGLGIIAFRSGSNEEAKRYLADAVSSSPLYQKAHYYYALALRKSGDKEWADQEFKVATELQKKHLTNRRLDLTAQ